MASQRLLPFILMLWFQGSQGIRSQVSMDQVLEDDGMFLGEKTSGQQHAYHDHHHTHLGAVEGGVDYHAEAKSWLAANEGTPRCDAMTKDMDWITSKWQSLRDELPSGEVHSRQLRSTFANQSFGPVPGVGRLSGGSADPRFRAEALEELFGEIPFHLRLVAYPGGMQEVGINTSLRNYLRQELASAGHFIHLPRQPGNESEEDRPLNILREHGMFPEPAFAMPLARHRNFLSIDGAGSGHAWHYHDSAWNLQTAGRKMWWVMPAKGVVGHGVDEDLPTMAPLINGEPYIQTHPCAMLRMVAPPAGSFSCFTQPGDLMMLTQQTWHSTCGLDDFTASVGGWLPRVDDGS